MRGLCRTWPEAISAGQRIVSVVEPLPPSVGVRSRFLGADPSRRGAEVVQLRAARRFRSISMTLLAWRGSVSSVRGQAGSEYLCWDASFEARELLLGGLRCSVLPAVKIKSHLAALSAKLDDLWNLSHASNCAQFWRSLICLLVAWRANTAHSHSGLYALLRSADGDDLWAKMRSS